MPNIQLNTVNTNSDIQNAHMMKSQIPVSMPVNMYNDDDDSSNNSKKSRKALFNKMQRSSPKLEKSFNEMTTSEKIALFQSLSNKDKLNLLNQSYKNTLRYVNSLSDEQKAAFLSKINSAVAQSGGSTNPSGSQDDSDSGITNIMMILVKAFVNNMNTDALDELQKTFEANLINQFLQNIQNQMKTQIAQQEKLAAEMSKGSGSAGKTAMEVIGVVVGVLAVVGMFIPPAEFIGGVGEALMDVGATTDTVADEGMMDGLGMEQGEDEGLSDLSKDPKSVELSEMSEKSPVSQPNADMQPPELEESPAGGQSSGEVTKETNGISKAEGKDSKSGIDKADKPRGRKRIWEGINQRTGKLFENGKAAGTWNVAKGLGKAGMYGVGAYYAGTSIYSLASPNGQQNEQNQITDCQSEISSGTNASDILNNNEQQVSKRVSDDSQRISQASGYVSQAINMLGNAMSFKV
ncbi:MAG: hypothetical protein KR126chlam4_00437 [Candidatus Anoxychlamydiales bacterium]|nr:hypothetical protein [Candidatus Anoxychlamydiales bacterium]